MHGRALIQERNQMSAKKQTKDASGLTPLELERIVPLAEAVRLSGLSADTWRRKYRDKWIRLSTRRYGVRVKDALLLSAE
jgi:hypothetical protein